MRGWNVESNMWLIENSERRCFVFAALREILHHSHWLLEAGGQLLGGAANLWLRWRR